MAAAASDVSLREGKGSGVFSNAAQRVADWSPFAASPGSGNQVKPEISTLGSRKVSLKVRNREKRAASARSRIRLSSEDVANAARTAAKIRFSAMERAESVLM